MRKTLILEGLQGLSKKDRVAFLRFIRSPYFNLREDLVQLAEFLLTEGLDLGQVTKKDVFQSLFGETVAYDDQKIRLLLSYLQKQLETFFTVEESKGSVESCWLTLAAMKKRNLHRNYTRKMKVLKSSLLKKKERDWLFFLGEYRIELENLETQVPRKGGQVFNYSELSDSLDKFYLSAKLKHACSALFYQSVYDKSYKFPLLDEVIKIASQPKFLENPAISIYYHFLKVIEKGEEVNFTKLKNDLFSQREALSEQEFTDVVKMVQNFYIYQINQNRLEFIPEALEFYKKGLEFELLFIDGYFSGNTYSNIVAAGIYVNDLDWTATFVEEYKGFLRKKDRNNTYCLNKARLEYTLKHYDEAIDLLEKIPYDELFYALTARIMRIKIYWEKGELEMLEHQLHSLKFFLKRKKVVGYHYNHWVKTIDFTRKMMELNPYDKERRERLKEDILAEDILAEKEWLLEQLDNL